MLNSFPTEYARLIRALNMPNVLSEVASGDLRLSVFDDDDDIKIWLFPPALIPLWGTSAGSIYGIWKHWFLDRETIFVEHLGETMFGDSRMTMEYANNIDQLLCIEFLNLVSMEYGVTDEVRALAERVGFSQELDAIEKIFNVTGDDPQGLLNHPCFAGNDIQSVLKTLSEYTGSYPNENMDKSFSNLSRYCTYEIHSWFQSGKPDYTLRAELSGVKEAPIWYRNKNQYENFNILIDENNLAGAWMSLNSIGWNFKDAKDALNRLSNAVPDNIEFKMLSNIWTALPFNEKDIY